MGEAGTLRILDENGNEIAVINKDYASDENGNLIINLEETALTKISIITSKPVQDGNLIVNVERAMKN